MMTVHLGLWANPVVHNQRYLTSGKSTNLRMQSKAKRVILHHKSEIE